MTLKRVLLTLAVLSIVSSFFFSNISFADSDSYITLEFDKTSAKVGEVIKGTLKINNISNFAGYQVNIRYNKDVLQPVNPDTGDPYTETTMPGNATLLLNADYSIFPIVQHSLSKGELNFGKTYLRTDDYKAGNKPESTGVLGVIGFKVLKDSATEIKFEESGTLPQSTDGTLVFDWDRNLLKTGYSVKQPPKINSDSSNFEPLPTLPPIPTLSPDAAANNPSDSDIGNTDTDKTDTTKEDTSKADTSKAENSNLPIIIVLSVIAVLLITVAVVFGIKKRK